MLSKYDRVASVIIKKAYVPLCKMWDEYPCPLSSEHYTDKLQMLPSITSHEVQNPSPRPLNKW